MRLGGINIGDFDTKFIIEEPTFTRNATTNEQIKTWSTFATVWGRWLKNSNERFEADQSVSLLESRILIRWISGVTEVMRVNDGSIYHYITGLDEIDRRVTMMLKTEKRDNV